MVIEEGVIPAGDFVYKMWTKDYAASMSQIRCTADMLDIPHAGEHGDILYTLFADEPSQVQGGATRFFVGGFATAGSKSSGNSSNTIDMKTQLLNSHISGKEGSSEFCDKREYEVGHFPSVKAGVTQFPFTNGFVSALLHTYKVIPAMAKYGKEHGVDGKNPVTFTTCSLPQKMCTHYVPLEKGETFFLGRPNTSEYAKIMAENDSVRKKNAAVDYAAVWRGMKKLSPL